MPFETLESLPDNVKKLSKAQQEVWRGAWNGRFKDCKDEGGSERECESSAFAVANAAIKKELSEGEAEKFYNGMVESWDIYQVQFSQEEAAYDALGSTGERACSNCRWFVSPSACIIVSNYPEPITPNGLSNKWLLRKVFEPEPLEVVIVGGSEHLDEDKATKTEGGVDYPASDYAVVPDADKPSGWKLRLAEGSAGNQTVAQVGRAITALQPGGFRGQKVELTSEQKSSAIRKIGGAIGRISGATAEQKTNLRERLDAVKSRTVQVTVPQRLVNAVKESLSSLLAPRGKAPSPFTLYKDANGDIRWFAWASNRWRDWDNPPEILAEKSHQDYVAYVDRTGHFPDAWLWHTPGSKWGKADWVDYADGFLMVSGTVDPGMEHVADTLALDKNLGVSHGFQYRHSDAEQGIIGWYRTVEISPLPIEAAANPWTSLEVLQKELDMGFSDAKRAFMVTHLGEDQVKRLEADTGALTAALEKAGVEWKELPEDGPDTPVVVEGINIKDLTEQTAKAAVQALTEAPAFKDMVAGQAALGVEVKGLVERLTALEKTEDEKIAAIVGGRNPQPRGHVASQDPTNTLSKEEQDAIAAFQGPSILDKVMEDFEVRAEPVAQ